MKAIHFYWLLWSLLISSLSSCSPNQQEAETTSNKTKFQQENYTEPVLSPKKTAHQKFSKPNKLTQEQQAFWEFLEQYNRYPTEEDLKYRKGEADFQLSELAPQIWEILNTDELYTPEFRFLERSKQSMLGNQEGLADHIPVFLQRYPWVEPMLAEYEISLEPALERFSPDIKQIVRSYKPLFAQNQAYTIDTSSRENYGKIIPGSEYEFAPTYFLETLLIFDFLAARGNEEDHRHLHTLINNFADYWRNPVYNPFPELRLKATNEYFWPLLTSLPRLVNENTASLVSTLLFRANAPIDYLTFRLWLVDSPELPLASDSTLAHNQITNRRLAHERLAAPHSLYNFFIKHGFTAYALYWMHVTAQPEVRPKVTSHNSPEVVVKNLFKNLHKQGYRGPDYKTYRKLLDDAYPAPPKEIAFLEEQARKTKERNERNRKKREQKEAQKRDREQWQQNQSAKP